MRHVEAAPAAVDTVALLRLAPLFARLPPDALAFLAQNARRERVSRGRILFHQATPANELWVVQRGGVKLIQHQPFGVPFAVRAVGPGGSVGLDVVAQQPRYSVSAVALCWSHLMAWSRDVVRRVTESNPALAIGAMRVLSGRLEDFRSRYRDLSHERAETRLARVLFRTYLEWTRAGDCGVARGGNGADHPMELPLSRRDLADIAGTTLYTVSRIVQEWERRGIVRAGRMRITLLMPTSLPLTRVKSGVPRAALTPTIATGDLLSSNVSPP